MPFDSLDLSALGFQKTQAKRTGSPPFHPGDLLKLYIYGYLNKVRSSRGLARECERNVELWWLLKGLQKVNGEMALIFLTYNLRRSMSILGVNGLIEVLKSAFGTLLRLWRAVVREMSNWCHPFPRAILVPGRF